MFLSCSNLESTLAKCETENAMMSTQDKYQQHMLCQTSRRYVFIVTKMNLFALRFMKSSKTAIEPRFISM